MFKTSCAPRALHFRAPDLNVSIWTSISTIIVQITKNNGLPQIRVTFGASQGSRLVSILFLSFIDDTAFVDCSKLMFADNTKIFRQVNCQGDADLLQADFNVLNKW